MSKLLSWKENSARKPLILKGARQVGKTHALLAFAQSHYPCYHYVNFEKTPAFCSAFEESLDPLRVIQALEFHLKTAVDVENDLVIFDEIQACPNALTSLKYFCEDLPRLDLCAAGSLLGIYLNSVSYPVGKVDHLSMYPMSFMEFLLAVGDDSSVELLQNLSLDSIIPRVAHEQLWWRLKHYFITGGLPEVVGIYCDYQEDLFTAFNAVRAKQNDLIEDYFSDIAKHSGKVDAMKINRVWRNIPQQLAQSQDGSAKKFKFKDVVPGINRYSKLADSLDWLVSAGLVIKTGIINKAALPFKAYTKENYFKLFLFDIGILGAMSEINPKIVLDYDYGTYKGYFAENYVAQAFNFCSSFDLYAWTENTSELEFVREVNASIIPIEVKSGWVTQAKSLKVFADKYQPDYRVIMSANKMIIDNDKKIHHLPLYLAECFPVV